jgi:hypothetical protein
MTTSQGDVAPMTKAMAIALVAAFWAGGAQAEWVQLEDAGITAALTDIEIVYDTGPTQRFYVSGRTFYDDARPSWGYWRVEGGQYCSQWPPSAAWACYDIYGDGTGAVRFVGSAGDEYIGRPVAE